MDSKQMSHFDKAPVLNTGLESLIVPIKGASGHLGKHVKDSTENRLSDPLLGTFTVSFFIVNWQFFYVLFSPRGDADTEAVLKLALGQLGTFSWAVPLFVTAMYVLPYPFLKAALSVFHEWIEVIGQNLRRQVRKYELLTTTERASLEAEYDSKFVTQRESLDRAQRDLQIFETQFYSLLQHLDPSRKSAYRRFKYVPTVANNRLAICEQGHLLRPVRADDRLHDRGQKEWLFVCVRIEGRCIMAATDQSLIPCPDEFNDPSVREIFITRSGRLLSVSDWGAESGTEEYVAKLERFDATKFRFQLQKADPALRQRENTRGR